MIILGGPDVNAISKEALSKLDPRIRFDGIALFDSSTKKRFVPSWTRQMDRITTDYGIILKTPNPFNKQKKMILIAGCFGYGTWAGVRFIMKRTFLENPLVSGGKSIECLIETDVVDDTPQDIRLIILRELT